jgi:hypothetical protein
MIKAKKAFIPPYRQKEKYSELDIYYEDGVDESYDDDELSLAEAGFMKGYLGC